VVDDDAAARSALGALLEARGMAVTLACSADEAMAVLAGGELPDAIVTDLSMPGRSGGELAELVRATPGWRAVPIVAMSACSRSLERLDGNADAKLLKPFDVSALLEALGAAHAARAHR
jgi:two-component system chemotaxis response regulator CheY